jgi:thiol-disulfide isomerase/thioredoxin
MPVIIATMDRLGFLRRTAAGALMVCALAVGLIAANDDRDAAPRFSARTLDGERYTNASLAGRPVLIQFWATWCPKCRGDQSAVDDITRDYADKGLLVLAVDVGESRRTVKGYLGRSPRACKIVANEDTNLPAVFGAKVYPLYVLIDKDGKVAGTQRGAGGEDMLRRLLRRAGL